MDGENLQGNRSLERYAERVALFEKRVDYLDGVGAQQRFIVRTACESVSVAKGFWMAFEDSLTVTKIVK